MVAANMITLRAWGETSSWSSLPVWRPMQLEKRPSKCGPWPPQARKQLKEVGWTKGLELAKLARRDGQHFDCATWLHKARQMPKEDFKQEVEKELTGRETEPWEIIYFKLYQSQMPVIERAIETAALMLGSDRSRGYCLEMICADFLAGANLDNGDPET